MTDELKKLVKETWCEYFSGDQNNLLETITPNLKTQYEETMLRLETDFELQRELGIGI